MLAQEQTLRNAKLVCHRLSVELGVKAAGPACIWVKAGMEAFRSCKLRRSEIIKCSHKSCQSVHNLPVDSSYLLL